MKVLIFPTDDRLGQASLIDHYTRTGHEVYIPAHGTLGLEWSRIAQWPALLCKDPSGRRNLDLYSLKGEPQFGEDLFVKFQDIKSDLERLPTVRICSEEEANDTRFDMYHTLRGAENYLIHYENLIKKMKNPNAKWVSSTMNHYDFFPAKMTPRNAAKIVPAIYEKHSHHINSFNIICTDIEFDLLGLSRNEVEREKIAASFNHNFRERQPEEYKIFEKMNGLLRSRGISEVKNYGGNIRKMGADIRYSENGPTGTFTTLTPLDALKKIKTLKCIVHFKQTDWGGGVFFNALHTITPIITTKSYVKNSNSSSYLIHDYNSLHVNSAEEAVEAIEYLLMKDEVFHRLSSGMKAMKNKLFDDTYWKNWSNFLDRLE